MLRLDGDAGWGTARCVGDWVLRCDARTRVTTLCSGNVIVDQWNDPVAAIQWLEREAANEEDGVRWVGYLGYAVGRLFEQFEEDRRQNAGTPLFCFARVKEGSVAPGEANTPNASNRLNTTVAKSDFTPFQYMQAVSRVVKYIEAGDVFQVNISQQFAVPFNSSPWQVADRLREATPARFGACLDFGDHAIVSNSPELFFEIDAGRVIRTRPIKGTRPVGPGMERELLDSEKDRAELNMIVDLERNDLGRICATGSVQVEQERTVEAHPTVYHGVATVAGRLRSDVGFTDVLRAMFPGGSITGAPKIRAMQIIDELEPVQRGVYCGAIGYMAGGGRMQFNVAIRTIVISDGVARFSVGGGIVADSDPSAEYEETIVKAKAMLDALGAVVAV